MHIFRAGGGNRIVRSTREIYKSRTPIGIGYLEILTGLLLPSTIDNPKVIVKITGISNLVLIVLLVES